MSNAELLLPTAMINSTSCQLCRQITLEAIVSGITLPLNPYLDTWRNGLNTQSPCGLCALTYHSLRHRINDRMDTLMFRYNPHAEAVLVAATSRCFLQTTALPSLLCGDNAEQWLHEIPCQSKWASEFACAFLSVNLAAGECT